MKASTVFALAALIVGSSHEVANANIDLTGKVRQNRVIFSCLNQQAKPLAFVVTTSTNSVLFTDTSALGNAQLPVNEPLGYTTENGREISISYDWYYTAQYKLSFSKRLTAIGAQEMVEMTLNGDDNDGAFFNNVKFSCAATSGTK